MDLKDKIILITGASGGIGSALCRELDEKGARLLLSGRDEKALHSLNNGLGSRHQVIGADLATSDGRNEVVETARSVPLDILINLAGILEIGLFDQQESDQIESMLNVNLLAPMLITLALLPQLKSRQQAIILNVGSILGSIGHPGFVAYCACKSGLKGFSEALSRELADSEVKLLYVAPRSTQTSLNTDRVVSLNQALGNAVDSPDWVAGRIVRQLQNEQSVRYLGWPEKFFISINALLPALVAWALLKKLPLIKGILSS